MIIGIDASRGNTLHRTGVEEYVFHILQEIKKSHTKASVFPENQEIKYIFYTREPLIAELSQLPPHVESRVLRWPPKRLWTQLRLSWEMLVRPPDVLFVPGHVVPLIHPKKTVMTVHDVAATVFPESFNWFERWYSVWAAKYGVKTLWKIIVPSVHTKEELGARNSSLVHVIPLAYDTAVYRVIDDEKKIDDILSTYHIQRPFLLSVGRLETKKNSARIVQAFDRLRESGVFVGQLVMVGGVGHGHEEVEQVIVRSPYRDDIIRPGFVVGQDLPYLMNAAEVFVFPSLYEGFGIPILEAFACGTPVVTSRTTSCAEVARGAAVLVDPMDVDDIARGVVDAMKGECVQKGLDRSQAFSWEKTVRATLGVILTGIIDQENFTNKS